MANCRYAYKHWMQRLRPEDKRVEEGDGLSKIKRDRKMCRIYELRQRLLKEQLNKKDGDYPI